MTFIHVWRVYLLLLSFSQNTWKKKCVILADTEEKFYPDLSQNQYEKSGFVEENNQSFGSEMQWPFKDDLHSVAFRYIHH